MLYAASHCIGSRNFNILTKKKTKKLMSSLECKNSLLDPKWFSLHQFWTWNCFNLLDKAKTYFFFFCVSCFTKQLFYPYFNLLTWLSLLLPVALEDTEISFLFPTSPPKCKSETIKSEETLFQFNVWLIALNKKYAPSKCEVCMKTKVALICKGLWFVINTLMLFFQNHFKLHWKFNLIFLRYFL